MIDFSLSSEQQALKDKVEEFVREKVIPFEKDSRMEAHGPTDDLRRELNALAREANLLAPHASKQWGGLGLGHVDCAIVFEAAGYSALGPTAMNCMAPDEANIHMLEKIATPEQQEQYLRPLVAADQRSCFAMTEPGGAGADPSLLNTEAVPTGDGYEISGRKWFITGAHGAGFVIIMANVPERGAAPHGPTMFLSPMDRPGIKIDRLMDTLDNSMAGGHAEMTFDRLKVGADAVLGEVGEGFRYAQVRLAPARLTHCMRWLGTCVRAHDVAVDYARQRQAFGKPIGEHEGVGFMLADNEIEIQQARLMIWHTAWLLDQGNHARHESSMAKVSVSEALFRIADRCVQVMGGVGVTEDTAVLRAFREVRGFRIYDGPSEVHRWAIARRVMKSNRPAPCAPRA